MNGREFLARFLVLGAALAAIAIPLALWWRVPLVHAQMAENGGWSPDAFRATVGVPLRLRLTSDDVMHGFAVGQHDAPAVDILPGQVTEVTLLFDQPGTYTYYCTRWCGLNHWRMRGTIEVTGSGVEEQRTSVPIYAQLGLDLDAPRAVEQLPTRKPVAQISSGSAGADLTAYQSVGYYRANSPYAVWQQLREDLAHADRDDQQLWDLTASLWGGNTTPEAVERGALLYAQNCAACHGEGGRGDGVFADDLAEAGTMSALADGAVRSMIQVPANLTDPAKMLDASPALLQGKILRGGMGTGMPSWGQIFTEEQTWDLVAYLYSFQFEYR